MRQALWRSLRLQKLVLTAMHAQPLLDQHTSMDNFYRGMDGLKLERYHRRIP